MTVQHKYMEPLIKYRVSPNDKEVIHRSKSNVAIKLERLVLKTDLADIVDDFHSPSLKLFVLPFIWDESNNLICNGGQHLKNNRLTLSMHNSREVVGADLTLLPMQQVEGLLHILLLGVVLNVDISDKELIFNKISETVKKSDLQKNGVARGAYALDQKIDKLGKRIATKIKGVKEVHCLMDYKGDYPVTNSLIIDNDFIKVKFKYTMEGSIPNMRGKLRELPKKERVRSISKPQTLLDFNPLASASGKIKKLLVTLPYMDNNRADYVAIIRELATQLDGGQMILMAQIFKDEDKNKALKAEIASIKEGIKEAENASFVLKEIEGDDNKAAFSIWVQDTFIVGESEGKEYIIVPYYKREDRDHDGKIADAAVEYITGSSIKFEGFLEEGNMLTDDKFILLGEDEIKHNKKFNIEALQEEFEESAFRFKRPIISVYAKESDYEKPDDYRGIPDEKEDGTREIIDIASGAYDFPHTIYEWRGDKQAIFHIDLFITLLGYNKDKEYVIMVGKPVAGFDIRKTMDAEDKVNEVLNCQLRDAEKRIEESLERIKKTFLKMEIPLKIIRNSLPLTYVKSGYTRYWYWATYNNAIVEVTEAGRKILMPSYGVKNEKNQQWSCLEQYDKEHKKLLEELGFKTYIFKHDFHFLAQKNGSLHCMTKCLSREAIKK